MRKQSSYPTQRTACIAAVGVTSLLIMLLSAGRIWLVPAHFSTDPNEGWNAFQALRALGAGPLYPPPGSLTGNNYPPLSFFIVGWAGRMTGDVIIAGRLIALVSMLIVAGCVFTAIGLIDARSRIGSVIGTLIFLGFNATIFRSYLAMNDPQWLGHALMTMGMVLLLARNKDEPLEAGRIVIAALLVLSGGFVKHNLVAFPLAVTLWLTFYDTRALIIWIATSALTLVVAAVLLSHVYGAVFFIDLVASDRHYSWLRMIVRSAGPVAAMLPMIVVASRLYKAGRIDRRINLVLLMVAISLPLGILERTGQGVDRNAHFETLIALSIATGVSLSLCGFASDKPMLLRPLPWLIVPFFFLIPGVLRADLEELRYGGDKKTAWIKMQDQVAATSGRVACETSAICYWAGKQFEIDFFLYSQYVSIHHDATALRQALIERRFKAIELDHEMSRPGLGEVRSPLRALILQAYHPILVEEDGRRLLAPIRGLKTSSGNRP